MTKKDALRNQLSIAASAWSQGVTSELFNLIREIIDSLPDEKSSTPERDDEAHRLVMEFGMAVSKRRDGDTTLREEDHFRELQYAAEDRVVRYYEKHKDGGR